MKVNTLHSQVDECLLCWGQFILRENRKTTLSSLFFPLPNLGVYEYSLIFVEKIKPVTIDFSKMWVIVEPEFLKSSLPNSGIVHLRQNKSTFLWLGCYSLKVKMSLFLACLPYGTGQLLDPLTFIPSCCWPLLGNWTSDCLYLHARTETTLFWEHTLKRSHQAFKTAISNTREWKDTIADTTSRVLGSRVWRQ